MHNDDRVSIGTACAPPARDQFFYALKSSESNRIVKDRFRNNFSKKVMIVYYLGFCKRSGKIRNVEQYKHPREEKCTSIYHFSRRQGWSTSRAGPSGPGPARAQYFESSRARARALC